MVSIMAGNRRSSEVPYQNYEKLKQAMMMKHRHGVLQLTVDPSFPPEQSSLTYVYSGDDRYERTKFLRPLELTQNATFSGVCGVWNVPFPWKQFKKRRWFEAAVLILSLAVRYMEKVIPGYRNCEQSFSHDYIGAFHFNIWRFGTWVETTVDDYLPVLDGKLMYSGASGDPPEFWGALLEKAYAKFNKAYEAIEFGNILDALTDLTGAICEYYTPDVNPPEYFFYILSSSVINRSLVICWRNEKLLTRTGFFNEQDTRSETENDRYLHIITAVTKFPLLDGRYVEVVRLKICFEKEPKWKGRYSDGDSISWKNIKKEFIEKYMPLKGKDDNEYWISLEDFQCNFGGLVICSNTDPYRAEGLSAHRSYTCNEEVSDLVYVLQSDLKTTGHRCHVRSNGNCHKKVDSKDKPKVNEIQVRETSLTVKMDTLSTRRHSAGDVTIKSDDAVNTTETEYQNPTSHVSCHFFRGKKHHSFPHEGTDVGMLKTINTRISVDMASSNSTSDISVIISRPHSAPMSSGDQETPRRGSATVPVSQLTQSNFIASKKDYFRPRGAWRRIVEHKNLWTRQTSGITASDTDLLSKCVRVSFTLSKKEYCANKRVQSTTSKKNLVIVSLLRDYRHGVQDRSNNLPVNFGFCLFVSRNPQRDEKRHLSKLQLIAYQETENEARELRTRLCLDDGSYIIVPYCVTSGHEGEYLLRIIGEKYTSEDKSVCVVC